MAIVVGLDEAFRPAGFVTIDPATGSLDQLCVAPAERGSGLAAALVDEAKRRASELKPDDPVLAWTRGYSDGGVIPIRSIISSPSRLSGIIGGESVPNTKWSAPTVRRHMAAASGA